MHWPLLLLLLLLLPSYSSCRVLDNAGTVPAPANKVTQPATHSSSSSSSTTSSSSSTEQPHALPFYRLQQRNVAETCLDPDGPAVGTQFAILQVEVLPNRLLDNVKEARALLQNGFVDAYNSVAVCTQSGASYTMDSVKILRSSIGSQFDDELQQNRRRLVRQVGVGRAGSADDTVHTEQRLHRHRGLQPEAQDGSSGNGDGDGEESVVVDFLVAMDYTCIGCSPNDDPPVFLEQLGGTGESGAAGAAGTARRSLSHPHRMHSSSVRSSFNSVGSMQYPDTGSDSRSGNGSHRRYKETDANTLHTKRSAILRRQDRRSLNGRSRGTSSSNSISDSGSDSDSGMGSTKSTKSPKDTKSPKSTKASSNTKSPKSAKASSSDASSPTATKVPETVECACLPPLSSVVVNAFDNDVAQTFGGRQRQLQTDPADIGVIAIVSLAVVAPVDDCLSGDVQQYNVIVLISVQADTSQGDNTAGMISQQQIQSLEQDIQDVYNRLNNGGVNGDVCDPFFRRVVDVNIRQEFSGYSRRQLSGIRHQDNAQHVKAVNAAGVAESVSAIAGNGDATDDNSGCDTKQRRELTVTSSHTIDTSGLGSFSLVTTFTYQCTGCAGGSIYDNDVNARRRQLQRHLSVRAAAESIPWTVFDDGNSREDSAGDAGKALLRDVDASAIIDPFSVNHLQLPLDVSNRQELQAAINTYRASLAASNIGNGDIADGRHLQSAVNSTASTLNCLCNPNATESSITEQQFLDVLNRTLSSNQTDGFSSASMVQELQERDCSDSVDDEQEFELRIVIALTVCDNDSLPTLTLQDDRISDLEEAFVATYNDLVADRYCDPFYRVIRNITFIDISTDGTTVVPEGVAGFNSISIEAIVLLRCRGCDPVVTTLYQEGPLLDNGSGSGTVNRRVLSAVDGGDSDDSSRGGTSPHTQTMNGRIVANDGPVLTGTRYTHPYDTTLRVSSRHSSGTPAPWHSSDLRDLQSTTDVIASSNLTEVCYCDIAPIAERSPSEPELMAAYNTRVQNLGLVCIDGVASCAMPRPFVTQLYFEFTDNAYNETSQTSSLGVEEVETLMESIVGLILSLYNTTTSDGDGGGTCDPSFRTVESVEVVVNIQINNAGDSPVFSSSANPATPGTVINRYLADIDTHTIKLIEENYENGRFLHTSTPRRLTDIEIDYSNFGEGFGVVYASLTTTGTCTGCGSYFGYGNDVSASTRGNMRRRLADTRISYDVPDFMHDHRLLNEAVRQDESMCYCPIGSDGVFIVNLDDFVEIFDDTIELPPNVTTTDIQEVQTIDCAVNTTDFDAAPLSLQLLVLPGATAADMAALGDIFIDTYNSLADMYCDESFRRIDTVSITVATLDSDGVDTDACAVGNIVVSAVGQCRGCSDGTVLVDPIVGSQSRRTASVVGNLTNEHRYGNTGSIGDTHLNSDFIEGVLLGHRRRLETPNTCFCVATAIRGRGPSLSELCAALQAVFEQTSVPSICGLTPATINELPPTLLPVVPPTSFPTPGPTSSPTLSPTSSPTLSPVSSPTSAPTNSGEFCSIAQPLQPYLTSGGEDIAVITVAGFDVSDYGAQSAADTFTTAGALADSSVSFSTIESATCIVSATDPSVWLTFSVPDPDLFVVSLFDPDMTPLNATVTFFSGSDCDTLSCVDTLTFDSVFTFEPRSEDSAFWGLEHGLDSVEQPLLALSDTGTTYFALVQTESRSPISNGILSLTPACAIDSVNYVRVSFCLCAAPAGLYMSAGAMVDVDIDVDEDRSDGVEVGVIVSVASVGLMVPDACLSDPSIPGGWFTLDIDTSDIDESSEQDEWMFYFSSGSSGVSHEISAALTKTETCNDIVCVGNIVLSCDTSFTLVPTQIAGNGTYKIAFQDSDGLLSPAITVDLFAPNAYLDAVCTFESSATEGRPSEAGIRNSCYCSDTLTPSTIDGTVIRFAVSSGPFSIIADAASFVDGCFNHSACEVNPFGVGRWFTFATDTLADSTSFTVIIESTGEASVRAFLFSSYATSGSGSSLIQKCSSLACEGPIASESIVTVDGGTEYFVYVEADEATVDIQLELLSTSAFDSGD